MSLFKSLGEKIRGSLNDSVDSLFFSENRDQLMQACRQSSLKLLDEEGFFTPVMVFVEMNVLSKNAIRLWQEGKLPALRPLIRLSDNMIERCLNVMKDTADQHSLVVRYMPFYDPRFAADDPERPILPFTLSHDQAMERALSMAVSRPRKPKNRSSL